MKVTVTNYIYPIKFSYRGWNVTLNKKVSFFSTVSVEAIFTPQNLADEIKSEQQLLKMALDNNMFNPTDLMGQRISVPTYSDYNKFIQVSNDYIRSLPQVKSRIEKFSASNGLDNFMGSNTTSTKKLLKKVEDFMNSNLPVISGFDKRPYKAYLKRMGVPASILYYISESPTPFM